MLSACSLITLMQRVPFSFYSPVRTLLIPRVNTSRSYASKRANPFPYPAQTNPQPHHIFHLPRNASQEDVKRRCMYSFHATAYARPNRKQIMSSFGFTTLILSLLVIIPQRCRKRDFKLYLKRTTYFEGRHLRQANR
jgi:hypothetical protein